MTPEQSRQLAKLIQDFSADDKMEFYYSTIVLGEDPVVYLDEDFLKASFGGDRSAAGRYAAQQRWKGHVKGDAKASWDTPTDDLEVAKATGRPISWLQIGKYPKEVQNIIDKRHAEYLELSKKLAEKAQGSDIEYRIIWQQRSAVAMQQKEEMDIAVKKYAKSLGMTDFEAEICSKAIYRSWATLSYEDREVDALAREDRLGKAIEQTKNPDVMIAVPTHIVEKMLRTDGRFKSQFETGTSRGSLSYEARSEQEAANFGTHPSVDPKSRPIYGYVRKGDASFRSIVEGEVRQYGEVHFVLKKEVHDRTTFTTEDSLLRPIHPAPLKKPNYLAAMPYYHGGSRYTEAQIHGGLSLKDVDRVVVSVKEAKDMADFDTLELSLRAVGIPVEVF
jgi:hypothetical protein